MLSSFRSPAAIALMGAVAAAFSARFDPPAPVPEMPRDKKGSGRSANKGRKMHKINCRSAAKGRRS